MQHTTRRWWALVGVAVSAIVPLSAEAQGRGRDAWRGVPPGHLPPPGECRVWDPGRPPGHQPPPTGCGAARAEAYRTGSQVLYGGRSDDRGRWDGRDRWDSRDRWDDRDRRRDRDRWDSRRERDRRRARWERDRWDRERERRDRVRDRIRDRMRDRDRDRTCVDRDRDGRCDYAEGTRLWFRR